ncbi:MAG: gliding motility-associated C-terminal domain-containing protein [Flavobacteriales bacterium]|jgi:gliding motility-associated-like protein
MKVRLILLLFTFGALKLSAQSCGEIAANVMCADAAPLSTSMIDVPVSQGCFSASMTYYTTFTTGSEAAGSITVRMTPGDCDDFTGPNTIGFTIIELPPGADACDPSTYGTQSDCYSDTEEFSATVNNLAANTNYLLLLGTNHLPAFGPCEFEIVVGGSAIDISTTVTPFLVYLGGTADLVASNASDYTWSPAIYLDDVNSATPVSTPEVTTDYTVTGTIGECSVSAQATVTVGPPLVIYNTITPNGDDINDTWTILGIERFEASVVTIYDRWGQQVFRSTGYTQEWDGTNRGKPLPMAAYYYVIELNSFEVEIPPITGVISIVK